MVQNWADGPLRYKGEAMVFVSGKTFAKKQTS